MFCRRCTQTGCTHFTPNTSHSDESEECSKAKKYTSQYSYTKHQKSKKEKHLPSPSKPWRWCCLLQRLERNIAMHAARRNSSVKFSDLMTLLEVDSSVNCKLIANQKAISLGEFHVRMPSNKGYSSTANLQFRHFRVILCNFRVLCESPGQNLQMKSRARETLKKNNKFCCSTKHNTRNRNLAQWL